jgi:DnaJ-class molecular chaperone
MTPHIDPWEAGERPSGDVLADLGFGVSQPVGSSRRVCAECDGDGFTEEGRAAEASGDSSRLSLGRLYCPACHGEGR